MEVEQIEKNLMKLFAKDKDIYQKRHIVFWYDSKGEFMEDIDSLNLEGVKVHKLNDNYFYTKYLLESEDPESNYLIYSNFEKPNSENNWLLDIGLYSQDFSADKASVILNDVGITNSSLKTIIEEHIKFFLSKKRKDDFVKLNLDKNSIKSIELSMLGVLVGEKSTNFDDILRKVLLGGFEENKYLEEFKKYNLVEVFWRNIKIIFSYNNDIQDLKSLFTSFVISNIEYSGEYKLPLHLQSFLCCSNHTNVFINNFMNHKKDYIEYRKLCNSIETELGIFNTTINDLDTIKDIETTSGVDKVILLTLANGFKNSVIDYEKYLNIISTRKTKHWYDNFEPQYEALENAIKIFQFKEQYSSGFQQITARELFEDYTNELYKMDSYYRYFNFYYDKAQTSLKDNYLNDLQVSIEGIYTNWYLDELTKKQISLLKVGGIDNWFIDGIQRQTDFYNKEVVNTLKGKNTERVFVVISDALRYESAVGLKELLEKERGITTISSMQGVIPSYTKLGMASLLPHDNIEIHDSGRIVVDDIDSSGTEGRNKILNKHLESLAITWKELGSHSQAEARDLFKNKKVVYIYHNVIDSTGDNAKTENKTFEACDRAIEELKNIIKRITNSWNGINVLITADHGFIYKRKALDESDKIKLEKIEKIDNSRRFIITKDEKDIEGTIKIDMGYIGNSGIKAVLPNGNSRFKIQGGGANFVHGSLSLQEIVVPIISYRYQKDLKVGANEYKREVNIELSNSNRVINNNMFTLVFHQKEALKGKLLVGNYRISLWDISGTEPEMISDEKNITADKTSDKIEERMFRFNLTLKSGDYDKNKNYRLRIFSDGKSPHEKQGYDFKIDILIQNDFDSIF